MLRAFEICHVRAGHKRIITQTITHYSVSPFSFFCGDNLLDLLEGSLKLITCQVLTTTTQQLYKRTQKTQYYSKYNQRIRNTNRTHEKHTKKKVSIREKDRTSRFTDLLTSRRLPKQCTISAYTEAIHHQKVLSAVHPCLAVFDH